MTMALEAKTQVIATLLGAAASSGSLRWMIPCLRRSLLDRPNARSSHSAPTPRGGGVSFVMVAVLGSLATVAMNWEEATSLKHSAIVLAAIPLLCSPLAVLGLLDDRLDLPAHHRYAVQLLTALALLLASPLVASVRSRLEGRPLLAFLPVAILLIAVTAVINFTNFMDGVDGLVAGCMTLALAAGAIQLQERPGTLPVWALVGGLLGFLPWNWSPAKVFMGDVGSTFLGAFLAGIVLQSPTWGEALGLLLVSTPLLADACLCVLRRLLSGQPILRAHRLHLFQRLQQAGWPHSKVALLYVLATACLAGTLTLAGWLWVAGLGSLVLLVGVWLDQHIAIPFAISK